MVNTINAVNHTNTGDIHAVDIRCPVCSKLTTVHEKSKTDTPKKSVNIELHCSSCGASLGTYNNLR